jgi:hypothetical protein
MKKIHWTSNMMTFAGALVLALAISLAFVAMVKGQGGGAFAFIFISILGTGLFTAGLLLNHDGHFANHEQQTQVSQMR